MTVCPFPNPKTPPNIVPMRPSCRLSQSRPDAAGRGALLPLASLHPHCNLLAPRNGTKWYRMVRKLNFSPARQPASQSGAWPWRPYCPWPLCIRTAICRLRNGTKWYRMVRKLNFSPARQPASQSGAWPWRPAPGLSASALQSASPYPHRNPEWDEMVQNGTETQFFPGGQPASQSRAWPWRPIAPGLSASALHSASAPEWDEMVQNGTETQFFPGPPTSKPVRGMAKEYQVRQVLKAIDKLETIND